MNQQGEAETKDDLGGEDDQRVQPGGAKGIEKEWIGQGSGVVAEADQRAIVRRDRLPDGDHERDGDDNEHRAERGQEDGIGESFLPAPPWPPGPYRLRTG